MFAKITEVDNDSEMYEVNMFDNGEFITKLVPF